MNFQELYLYRSNNGRYNKGAMRSTCDFSPMILLKNGLKNETVWTVGLWQLPRALRPLSRFNGCDHTLHHLINMVIHYHRVHYYTLS